MGDRNVRRDVRAGARADAWDDAMLAYARAVGAMQARPPFDPTSWAAQAALHRDCPRGTWFFLPWIRMHLWYLERIVRATVVEHGGPRDWSLPFWASSDGGASAALPAAFAAPELPDGAPNPLFRPDGERAACLNAGRRLPDTIASADRALAAPTFSPGLGGDAGVPTESGETPPPGLLEAQPYATVAAALGREPALDPVFPLHLANVDRLWEVWLARGEGRAIPSSFDWKDRAFCFRDADQRLRSLTCGQVGDLSNLDYRYAGLPAPAPAESVLCPRADRGPVERRGRRLQIAGGEGVELGAEPRRVSLSPAAAVDTTDRDASRVYLCVEDAEGEGAPGSVWEVRVEGGDGAAAVGTIALAGAPAGARRFVFDVTDAVADPGAEPTVISFHPALPPGFLVEPVPTARVGRVTLMRA
jgi:Common central domain of tyrosinase